ncbi:MAG: hypothetical protein ACPGSL_06530 [Vicingaceae bacterium]
MKNIIYTTLILLITLTTTKAQNKATPLNFEGKDFYVLLSKTNKTTTVKSLSLTKEQINKVSDFADRIELIIKNAPTNNYDAIYTRDGIAIQYLKYPPATDITKANANNFFGLDLYFLASPTKKYKVIDSRPIQFDEIKLSFYNLTKKIAEEKSSKKYDAIIITQNQINYVRYK